MSSHLTRYGLIITVASWLVLSIIVIAAVQRNLSAPGLYYDEAVFGGLAKDFVTGRKRLHMPGCETLQCSIDGFRFLFSRTSVDFCLRV